MRASSSPESPSPESPSPARAMTPADLDVALGWAADEGWNPGLDDAARFRVADPAGFLALHEGDEPVASISVVRYGDAFGFLGLYIVRPDRRGRGLGMALWRAGMAHLGRRVVGLDGVVAQQANYARSGFAAAHRSVRYTGTPSIPAARDPTVTAPDPAMLPAFLTFDRAHFPAPRTDFLRGWLFGHGHVARVRIVDGSVAGYGVRRPCRAGAKIGPLFARDAATAEALALALLEGAEGPVALDVPEPNAAGAALARRLGLAPVFETARMYRGPAPELPLGKVYGLTTFELG